MTRSFFMKTFCLKSSLFRSSTSSTSTSSHRFSKLVRDRFRVWLTEKSPAGNSFFVCFSRKKVSAVSEAASTASAAFSILSHHLSLSLAPKSGSSPFRPVTTTSSVRRSLTKSGFFDKMSTGIPTFFWHWVVLTLDFMKTFLSIESNVSSRLDWCLRPPISMVQPSDKVLWRNSRRTDGGSIKENVGITAPRRRRRRRRSNVVQPSPSCSLNDDCRWVINDAKCINTICLIWSNLTRIESYSQQLG